MKRPTFIQQQRVVEMAALGANPLPTPPADNGDVLVLVSRGDGLPEVKCVAPGGAVRSVTHPHEDRPAVAA